MTDENEGAFQSFVEWCWMDYRPTPRAKTNAEKLQREEDLSPPELRLLRGRMESYPTIYRTVEISQENARIVLEDVLVGGRVTVHDRAMAMSGEEGWYVCARTYPAGDFTFIAMTGPVHSNLQIPGVVEFLAEEGMEFTPEGMRENAHLFGRLWEYVSEMRRPDLVNFDGDPLRVCRAYFNVPHEEDVRPQLQERDDIEVDEDEYVWFRDATPEDPDFAGDIIVLGRLWFDDDGRSLRVETNSPRRMDRALEWLNEIRGIEFGNVSEEGIDDLMESRGTGRGAEPPAEEDEELPPEVMEAMEEHLRQYYMDWLDQPLPALDGRTPRQACRTEEGRTRVAALIRSFSAPMGPGGEALPVPRRELFEELGIEQE